MSPKLKTILDNDGWLPLDDAELSAEWITLQDRDSLIQELVLTVFSWRQSLRHWGDPVAEEDVVHFERLMTQIVEALAERGELCGPQPSG